MKDLAPRADLVHPGEVLVLLASIADWTKWQSRFEPWLSSEERAKSLRFHFAEHARAYVVAHGLLRAALGWALTRDPAGLVLVAGRYGKPVVAVREEAEPSVHFNLSHSERHVAIALTLAGQGASDGEIGVDIESTDRAIPPEVVSSIASPAERQVLEAASPEARARVLHRLWTRKEAVTKATGFGLSLPLQSLNVVPAEPTPTLIRGLPAPADPAATYWLYDLFDHDGCSGAVAVKGEARSPRFVPWPAPA